MRARFDQKWQPDPFGCHVWTAAHYSNGYGMFDAQLAHRVAWKIHIGPVPGQLCVLHHCDVRNCVNPEHLFLGTKQDNTRDMVAKGRHGMSKLQHLQDTLRFFHMHGFTYAELGRRFGATEVAIRRCILGETYQ